MATELQIIQTLVKSLDRSTDKNGIRALDAAIRACSNYQSTQELIDDFVAKCNTMRGKNAQTINNFLKHTCGIDLYNNDTGAITGLDAGGSTEKTAETVVPEPYYGNQAVHIDFRYNGTMTLGSSANHSNLNVKLPSYQNESEKKMIAGLYNWWITGATKLVYDSYGLYFNKSQDSTDSNLPYFSFDFVYNKNNTLATTTWWGSKQKVTQLGIYINMYNYPNFTWIKNGNVSGYTSNNGSEYFDRVLAHEMTHAMFDVSLDTSLNKSLPQFFKEGIAELVHGVDDSRRANILNLVSGKSSLTNALNLNNSGTGENDAYAAGYLLLRYLAHQTQLGNKPAVSTSTDIAPAFAYSEDGSVLTVPASYKNEYVKEYKDTVTTIDATKASRFMRLWGNDYDNLLQASAKGSFLWGRGGNDTLQGNKGVDTFRFYGDEGNDTITNYQSGQDIISLGSANYGALKRADVNGSDVILSVGDGTLTLKNGKGKKIKIAIDDGKTSIATFTSGGYTYDSTVGKFLTDKAWAAAQAAAIAAAHKPQKGLVYNDDFTTLTASSAYGSKSILASNFRDTLLDIDASAIRRYVTLNGNTNNNVLKAGKYGSYMWGQTGDDTLYGGNGVDTFRFYGDEGNDTVIGYQSTKDIISLGSNTYGELKSATVNGNDVILSVGDGTLTIKDGKEKIIRITDGNGYVSYTRFVSGTTNYNSNTARFTASDDNEVYTLFQKSITGLAYNSNRTALTAKKDFTLSSINANYFWWTVKSINVSAADHGVNVFGNETITSMTGSKYEDILYANGRSAVLKGGAGDDTLRGGSVSSKLYGGTGNDFIYTEAGTAYLYGEAGDDTLSALTCINGKSYLYGGEGNDTLSGGEGLNLLNGDNGNDILIGGKNGTNTINGGNGDDELYGGNGENTINKLNGGNGNDTMYGGEGTNTLRGGNGNDTLTGGSGTNLLYGDAGNDTITGGSGLSKLYGGVGNDFLTGGSDINELYGGAGNDELHGGQDTNGSYLLKGEAGNDTIVGGAGYNTLWGGAGKDTLTGGTGENTYYFASLGEMAGDTITNLKGNDVLYFNLKTTALDLDAIYKNYNLGHTTGKNTISLEGETLTITDKTNHKYRMNLAGGYSGNITLQNNSQQQQSFKF